MKLFGYWRSSSTYRVRIGLGLKKLDYETVVVSLLKDGGQQNAPAHKQRNLMAQVPVLEVEHEPGHPVLLKQSVAILEYLEERYPEPSLFPQCAYLKARVRACVEIVNSGIQPLHNLGIIRELKQAGMDEQAFARRAMERGLAALEIEATESESKFLIGDQVSMADLFLIPQLFQARRFGVDLAAYPALVRIEDLCNAMPAFAGAHPQRQPDADPNAT